MNPLAVIIIVAIAFAAGVAWGRRGRSGAYAVGVAVRPGEPGPPPRRSGHGYNCTDDVRNTLAQAREEAGVLGHQYVGPEHILLGLIHVDARTIRRVFERLRIEPAALRTAILGRVEGGPPHTGPDLPYTARAKRVLENAMIAARDLGHDYVGDEHLLLALAQDSGSVGKALADAGADVETLRREIDGTAA